MIKKVNSVNFTAKYINLAQVSAMKTQDNRFHTQNVSFIEFDLHNRKDLAAVNKLPILWPDAKFIRRLSTLANWASFRNSSQAKIYALSEQLSNFENIQSESILGILDVSEKKNSKKAIVEYLQINPKAIHVNNKNEVVYKGAGTAVLESLKKIYNRISLKSEDDENIKRFYKNNNFRESFFDKNSFIWNKSLYEKIKCMLNKIKIG